MSSPLAMLPLTLTPGAWMPSVASRATRPQSDSVPMSDNWWRTATALRARRGPAGASGGALRAALTRAHAAATVQLHDEGDAFVVLDERTSLNASPDTFSLTEESRSGWQPAGR